ncbi:hypothetical protein ANCDUO_16711 [Ancylostoma duodenale]|uniref:SCP domain-containing protein n=1 Tax=Ancylostoma duodenale TaxID=51022 RepID=A0A0C2FX68_9BILA|nr:hypothetical protein ANCDUO_16711 [Ancylostoma duodenale]
MTYTCSNAQYPTFTEAERQALLDAHNALRKKIAEGRQPNYEGMLPKAKNMYQLLYDCAMEYELMREMEQCTGRATLSQQYGQNILV